MRKKESMEQQTEIVPAKDGNGSDSVRVECLGTQNRNPNLNPEPNPNSVSGTNSYAKPKPADTRNPNPKPEFFLQTSNSISKFPADNKQSKMDSKVEIITTFKHSSNKNVQQQKMDSYIQSFKHSSKTPRQQS